MAMIERKLVSLPINELIILAGVETKTVPTKSSVKRVKN
jgi:hypothetical protein